MKRLALLPVALSLLFFGCSDETTIYETAADDIRTETDQTVLDNGILYERSGVLDIYEEDNLSGKSAEKEMAGDYPLTLVAQVDVPSFRGGENLTASHVHIDGSYAYVSYNTPENGYVGGVDIINIADPTTPRITARLYYTNADINALAYSDGHVYLAGGVDAEKSVTATDNSFVAKIQAVNGRFNLDAGVFYGFQPGYNATDIEIVGDKVLLTSGRDGIIAVYDKDDLERLKESPFDDLRSVAVKGNEIAVLNAGQGVSILNSELSPLRNIAIDSDFGFNTKRTLDFNDENIVVAEGSKGAGIYNATTGQFVQYVPIMLQPEGNPADHVTNAVAVNEGVLLMANGASGLCLSEEDGDNKSLVGIIQLEGSINFVASQGDYAFAASGREGLQIIKLNKPNASLVNRCATLEAYRGSANLNVNSGEEVAYRGAKRFNTLNINGTLLLCGSWTVRNDVNLNSDGLFEMNGTLVVGRNNRRRNITVNSGATLRIEGNLTLFGDLTLNDGATLEFIGDNSVVNIFGKVNKNGSASVKGTYRDVRGAF
ncbi:hypothetical protein [Maribacter sp. 2307ULW6-5]|uniref:hypothetical protein n=1 Tax=Maribacter sp. 2307ULW6-5 TaxID=3386275 RepID=UPI0039BD862C